MAARCRISPRICPPGQAGAVAQLGERRNRTAEVRGSDPLGSTKQIKTARWIATPSVAPSRYLARYLARYLDQILGPAAACTKGCRLPHVNEDWIPRHRRLPATRRTH